jgi:nucleotide-binding universal stress UspA family protein
MTDIATDTDAFRQVLVAIDDTPVAEEILRRAGALIRNGGASLTVLHVATPIASSFDTARGHARAERSARKAGERLLEEARVILGTSGAAAELHFGDPAEIICRRAADIGADVVVVGSRGLGKIEALVLGSVSDAVVRRAPCSVLVVRPTV